MKKIITLIIFICCVVLIGNYTKSITANNVYRVVEYNDNGQIVREIDRYNNFDEANSRRRSLGRTKNYGVLKGDVVVAVTYGVVNFNTSSNVHLRNYNIENAVTKEKGYFNGAYAADAPYLGTFNNESSVLFRLAGANFYTNIVNGDFKVEIMPYSPSIAVSRYTNDNGILRHYISTNVKQKSSYYIEIAPSPSYLKQNTIYYSYDGHYFYNDYKTMINDLVVGNFNNAVNANNPFYNYYLYLPYRSQTNYTNADFANWFYNEMAYNKAQNYRGKMLVSKFNETEKAFVDSQNIYGANGLLTYSIARNESADGYSSIAQNKLNLFGHNAYDSSAYANATGYETNASSIYYHAEKYVSKGYTYVNDFRYFGSHVGDKVSGLNVKYASDPYWGEKAAKNYYRFDRQYGLKDYQKYTLGIIKDDTTLNVYSSPKDDSPIFSLKKINERSVIILGKETYKNQVWYKIQSDSPVNQARNGLQLNFDGKYDFNKQYVYIPASIVKHVFEGKKQVSNVEVSDVTPPTVNVAGEIGVAIKQLNAQLATGNTDNSFTDVALNTDTSKIHNKKVGNVTSRVIDKTNKEKTSGIFATGDKVQLVINGKVEKTLSVIVLGDVNGDGEVDVSDIAAVLRHIEGRRQLSGEYLQAANIAKEDEISVSAIAAILRHIEGLRLIK